MNNPTPHLDAHVAAVHSTLANAGMTAAHPKAQAIVQKAQATANQKVFGAPGVDEGTATMAGRISEGQPVANVKSQYTRVGNRNYPRNTIGNAEAKAAGAKSEADQGDMSHWKPPTIRK